MWAPFTALHVVVIFLFSFLIGIIIWVVYLDFLQAFTQNFFLYKKIINKQLLIKAILHWLLYKIAQLFVIVFLSCQLAITGLLICYQFQIFFNFDTITELYKNMTSVLNNLLLHWDCWSWNFAAISEILLCDEIIGCDTLSSIYPYWEDNVRCVLDEITLQLTPHKDVYPSTFNRYLSYVFWATLIFIDTNWVACQLTIAYLLINYSYTLIILHIFILLAVVLFGWWAYKKSILFSCFAWLFAISVFYFIDSPFYLTTLEGWIFPQFVEVAVQPISTNQYQLILVNVLLGDDTLSVVDPTWAQYTGVFCNWLLNWLIFLLEFLLAYWMHFLDFILKIQEILISYMYSSTNLLFEFLIFTDPTLQFNLANFCDEVLPKCPHFTWSTINWGGCSWENIHWEGLMLVHGHPFWAGLLLVYPFLVIVFWKNYRVLFFISLVVFFIFGFTIYVNSC